MADTVTKYQDYPFAGFSFSISFTWPNLLGKENEGNFQEVSGLNIKLETESIKEGGENRFSHRFPLPPKYENLVLRRGMFRYADSGIAQWAQKSFSTFEFTPKDINISLLDEKRNPLANWNVKRAYPVGVKVSDFKAQENALVVETLELAFDYFERTQ